MIDSVIKNDRNMEILYDSSKPIIIIKTKNQMSDFLEICKKVSDNYKKAFMCIDFEYNTNRFTKQRKLSSMQIMIIDDCYNYFDTKYQKSIYILDPINISNINKKELIKYVFCSKIIKIIHGSDSLDIPYTYKEILNNDNKKITKFLNYLVDTRFLCEITKIIHNKVDEKYILNKTYNKKCSIYNALYDLDVIDKIKYDALEFITSKIDYKQDWRFHKLTLQQIIYSAYDVFYLYDLLFNIVNRFDLLELMKCYNNICKINLISLINRLYRFHMLNRLKIINSSELCQQSIVSNISKNKLIDSRSNDQSIMNKQLGTIKYFYNNDEYLIQINIGDILKIDTIRKSILYCIRSMYLISVYSKLSDSFYIPTENDIKNIKGYEYILLLISSVI